MSNCQELITIFDRIQNRVDKGSNNYAEIAKYINSRVRAEEDIIQILKKLIPAEYDQTDPLLKLFFEGLKTELERHNKFKDELRKASNSSNSYTTTMRENQKRITQLVRSSKSQIQKAVTDTEKAQKDLEYQKSRCTGLAGTALAKQQQKVQIATQALASKSKAEVQATMTVSSQSMPNIHRIFSEFDTRRLNNVQKSTVQFGQLHKQLCEACMKDSEQSTFKLEGMDCEDRSKRYIGKVFDTTTAEVKEDENIETYATALADYQSREPRDLQFERGDKIRVINQHHSGWWEGDCEGRKGFFPRTFVIMPGDIDLRKDPIGAVFLVTKDYNKTRGGDIDLLTGDLVYVDFLAKGRCSGTNIRDRKRGFFPLDCLECKIT